MILLGRSCHLMMAPVQLPCPVGDCNHKTIQLEYAQAKEQLDIHVKYTHAAVGGESSKKPAQLPRLGPSNV